MADHEGEKIGQQNDKSDADKNKTRNKRHYFQLDASEIYLTQRQLDISLLLLKNLTYKKIAEILGIVDRTVECHVSILRLRLNCKNKKALITKLEQLPLREVISYV